MKMTDTELLDYLESKGCVEIECNMTDQYSVNGAPFRPNLRIAILAAMVIDANKRPSPHPPAPSPRDRRDP
jgi:hypothetical protein